MNVFFKITFLSSLFLIFAFSLNNANAELDDIFNRTPEISSLEQLEVIIDEAIIIALTKPLDPFGANPSNIDKSETPIDLKAISKRDEEKAKQEEVVVFDKKIFQNLITLNVVEVLKGPETNKLTVNFDETASPKTDDLYLVIMGAGKPTICVMLSSVNDPFIQKVRSLL